MKMKLSHVAIGCASLDKMAAFYSEVLGLPQAFRLEEMPIVYLDAGNGTFVELLGRGGEPEPASRTGLAHLCFEVESMEAELERLAALGVRPESPPKRGGDGNLQAWITDPEGGRIELMQLAPDGRQKTYLQA